MSENEEKKDLPGTGAEGSGIIKETEEQEPLPEKPSEEEEQTEGPEKKNRKEERSLKKECAELRKECDAQKKELSKLKKELEASAENERAQNERYLRMMAEYDNFRRRSASEKDGIYADACTDVLKEILPTIDALELAVGYGAEGDGAKVLRGVEMTLSKFNDALAKLGVEPVKTEVFDPNLHNAVMHVEDETKGEGEILEVFQKGYKKGDKVIRYAMVKVAN